MEGKSGMINRGRIFALLFVCALLSFQIGCSSGGGGGGSATGTDKVGTVSISSGSAAIVADGSAQTRITIDITDTEGDPIKDGVNVTVTTTAGDLDSAREGVQSTITVATKDGEVVFMLTSSTNVGTATITATADGVNDSTTVNFVAASASRIVLTASPNNLTADGKSTSTITARVTDSQGNAVADGENISFRIAGTGTISPPTARTQNGVATIEYTASKQVGTEVVTAESTSGTVAGSVPIELIKPTVGSVAASSGSESIVADGVSQALITARVVDRADNPVEDGTAVSFAATAGTLGTARQGGSSSITAYTVDGEATVSLTSTTNLGTSTITVTAGGISKSVTVNFVSGTTANLAVTATPNALTADGSSTSAINVAATDSSGNPAQNGEIIGFSIVSGGGTLSSPTATTSNGAASVVYTAGSVVGSVTIEAKIANGTSASVQISLNPGTLAITTTPDSLSADGVSTSSIRVVATDEEGYPVRNGEVIRFAIVSGSGMLSSPTATTSNGIASVVYTAGKTVGNVTIEAKTSNGTSSTIQIRLISGNISIAATPASLVADGASTSTIRVVVTDDEGNPVRNGEVIRFAIVSGGGTLSSPTATTSNGIASVTYTAGKTVGNVTIEAKTSNDTSATVQLNLVKVFVGSVNLASGATQIVADGKSEATISATARDTKGNSMPDGTSVNFSTTAGTLSSNGRATTINGVARISLTSSTNVGTVTVTGSTGGVAGTVSLQFVAGASLNVRLRATPDKIVADGVSTSQLRADVTDAEGNAVADGELVSFFIESGQGIIGPPVTARTSGGAAQVTFKAPDATGVAAVVAETVNGNRGRTNITMVAPGIGAIVVTADPPSIVADGSSTTVFATVKYVNGIEVEDGTRIDFETTAGTFEGGVKKTNAQTVGGVVSVRLYSSKLPETATVTAKNGLVSGKTDVNFTAVPGFLALSLSRTSVKSDNSNFAIITATALDANRVPVEDITVAFRTSAEGSETGGGQLGASSVQTNEGGEAKVEFRSGTVEKKNQTVTIEAWVPAYPAVGVKQIPIQITGTTLVIATTKTNLEIDPANPSKATTQVTVTVKDAGEIPINDAPVTVAQVVAPGQGEVAITPPSGNTNVSGVFTVTITGTVAGSVTIKAESLGAQGTQNFIVGTVGEVFGLVEPTADPVSLSTDQCLKVRVKAPNSQQVRFATSLGSFIDVACCDCAADPVYCDYCAGEAGCPACDPGNGSKSVVVNVANGFAEVYMRAPEPGVATVEVIDVNDPSIKDSVTVIVSAPSDEAAKISLQANATVVAPSTDTIQNTVTLTITVKTKTDQVVGGAPVILSIINPTGGGESLSPVIVFTNDFGQAQSTFTSGSLSSDSRGVTVKAELVINPAVSDSVDITIGGTAGSIEFGRGTTVESIANNTMYSLPMSVMVSDSNGNPVVGAVVTLGAWPLYYYTGMWVPAFPTGCVIFYTSDRIPNEDDPGRNLILDPGEDANNDGQLTPPNSAAGTLPASLVTGENGSVEFNLVYLKSSAGWIEDELSASTLVLGTETRAKKTMMLPWLEGEECNLPASPYDAPVNLEASISLSSDEYVLPADGVSATNIYAVVLTESGQPVVDGTVFFSLSPAGAGTLPGNGSAPTNENGVASIRYTAAIQPGVVTVTGQTASGLSDSIDITLDQPVGRVLLFSSGTTGKIANGTDFYQLTAQVLDPNDQPVGNEQVIFSINTYDAINGIVSVNPISGFTSADGTFTANVTNRSAENDDVQVIASAGDKQSSPMILSFIGSGSVGPDVTPAAVAVTASRDSINPAETTRITAAVYDASGGVIPGVQVLFTLDNPSLAYIQSAAVTDNEGKATATLTARDLAGEVKVTATAGPVSNTPPKTIIILDQSAPDKIELIANPTSILVQSTATIVAEVLDASTPPLPVDPGTRVSFEIANPLYGTITASSQTNASGFATATFQALNVPGTAVINVQSGNATASVNIKINQAPASSIEFISANPNVIARKESGGIETSIIKFRVNDSNGNPLEGVQVDMAMEGPNGEEKIDASEDGSPDEITVSTDSSGIATVLLQSGYIAGPVKVSATIYVNESPVTIQSSVVSIGGGVPSAKRFSVSAEKLNLPGLEFNNKTTGITAYFADRFGNVNVLQGTTVSFITEAGLAVQTSAVTLGNDGVATVTARTQQPIDTTTSAPENVADLAWENSLRSYINNTYWLNDTEKANFTGNPRDGLCSVLIYARGEEEFTDTNGNGWYDPGEPFSDTMGDPFVDYNDDGTWTAPGGADPGEQFIDADNDGVWDGYANPGVWDSNKYIFGNFRFLITGKPRILFDAIDFFVEAGGQTTIKVLICDQNLNPLPPGTSVGMNVIYDSGIVGLGGKTTHDYPNSNVIGDSLEGHKILIEFPIVVSDESLGDWGLTPATITVTVTWEGTSYREIIKGNIDMTK